MPKCISTRRVGIGHDIEAPGPFMRRTVELMDGREGAMQTLCKRKIAHIDAGGRGSSAADGVREVKLGGKTSSGKCCVHHGNGSEVASYRSRDRCYSFAGAARICAEIHLQCGRRATLWTPTLANSTSEATTSGIGDGDEKIQFQAR